MVWSKLLQIVLPATADESILVDLQNISYIRLEFHSKLYYSETQLINVYRN